MATIFENLKKFASISAACGLVATSNACLVAGKETGLAARKVAGDNWDKVPGSARNDRLLQAVIAGTAPAPKAASAPAQAVSHSPLVEWDEWHWVPSQAAQEQARARGQKEAFLQHLYKGSNALICLAKYGKGDLGKVFKGRSYAEWICMAIAGHAEYLRSKKGVTDAFSRLGQYYDQAVKRAFVPCPSWEEVKAAAAAAANLKHSQEPEPVPQPASAPEPPVEEVPEVREGRAPAFDDLDAEAEVSDAEPEPEEVVRKYDELRKVVGVTAVRANNAKSAAEKAAAAFKAGKINSTEFGLFLEKAASKFPEGSKEAAEILSVA